MRSTLRFLGLALLGPAAVAGCSGSGIDKGLDAITRESVADHVKVLASDEFEGRGPSSPGEEKTIKYLEQEFRTLGLEPGNNGSFFQEVPLVAITANPSTILAVRTKRGVQRYAYGKDFMAWTKRVVKKAAIRNSPMIFVGYGIVAPEYGWNDYDGLDVKGKTVVILVNDPGFATKDENLFNGNAMTYYGRWTYKYEEAARQGAAAAIIVHETEPAGYGWDVVSNSWSGPQFDLVADDKNMSRVAVEGWITHETATGIFKAAGLDYEDLKQKASQKGFRAVPMNIRASLALENSLRESTSHNVVAVLPGSERPDEYIIYTAHWDHLGKDPNLEGDQIYNGARDNATGTAGLLELAKAFTALPKRPARSIMFLAVTAEEQGLLGSAYYATHPLVPVDKTVADLNMDAMNTIGATRDITVVGYGNSELDDYVDQEAAEQGRTVRPDPEPEKGYYYRSDHFSFAKEGIPALYLDPGVDNVEHGVDWNMEKINEYTRERYHKPQDEFSPDWDLSGMVQDLKLFFRIGYRLSNETTFPNWREGNEFRAKRDSEMGTD